MNSPGLTEEEPVTPRAPALSAESLLLLHAALDVDALWSAFLRVIQEAMPQHHVYMALQCIDTMPMTVRISIPVGDVPQYFAKLDAVAPLSKMLGLIRGKTVSRFSDVMPNWLVPLTPFYRKIMKPNGWRYPLAIFFWEGDRLLAHAGIARAAEHGDFTDAEVRLLEAWYPHFEIALRRVLQFDKVRGERAPLEASLRNAPLPTAALDWNLAVIFTNKVAASASALWIPGAEDPRVVQPEFTLPTEIREGCLRLRGYMEKAVAEDLVAEVQRQVTVAHPAREGFRAVINLLPPGSGQFAQPHFLVAFHHPLETGADGAKAAAALSQLSAAERSVALEAAKGMDNSQIAAALGISVNTVRAHLRNIFPKLGIQSRAQLAALLKLAE
jgi:DNA-binding CsgD family transcriptional regulator